MSGGVVPVCVPLLNNFAAARTFQTNSKYIFAKDEGIDLHGFTSFCFCLNSVSYESHSVAVAA